MFQNCLKCEATSRKNDKKGRAERAAKSKCHYAQTWQQNAKRCLRTQKQWFSKASVPQPSSSSNAHALQPGQLSSSEAVHESPMQTKDPASIAVEDAFTHVSFGHISYGSSEWFWAMDGPLAPPRQPEKILSMLRKYEPVICRKSTTPGEYKGHVVAYRRQRRIEDLMSASVETHAQSVSRVQSQLNNDLQSFNRPQIRQLAQCFPSCGQKKSWRFCRKE